MNIALSAVIISILLISPVVFYFSLYIGEFPRAIPKFSLFEGILGTAVISLLIHAVAILCIPDEIRFDILIKVLGGDLKNVESTVNNAVFKDAVTDFAWYNLLLLLAMVVLGRLIRFFLLRTGLHERVPALNLFHEWWYFFDGAFAGVEDYDLVFVDTKDGTVIFSGFLMNFETEGANLDRIYLKDVTRREFKKYANDEGARLINESGDPLTIPSGTFSLKYSNIINLSVNFIILDDAVSNPEEDLQIL
ncbi:hypothetical protein ABDD95_12755 [Mucilaginibacter sp. PAMB04274]|uniref:hypothetical protein n=1 Tax=Mucilaginibacter sp. PAMB04274 TaxID=3138568 RepID=UPI0031F5F929